MRPLLNPWSPLPPRPPPPPRKKPGELALKVAHYGVEIRRTFVLVGSPRITFVAVVPCHRASHFLSNTVG